MKHLSLIFLTILLGQTVIADDLFQDRRTLWLDEENYLCIDSASAVYFGYAYTSDKDRYWQEIQPRDIVVDSNGYQQVSLLGQKYWIISGGGYLERFTDYVYGKRRPELHLPDLVKQSGVDKRGIQAATTSSYLTEKTATGLIEYRSDGLVSRFANPDSVDGQGSLHWNFDALPWVPAEHRGIGEKINLRFAKATTSLVVLNGFVDIERPDLFRKNSRIRSLAVQDQNGKVLATKEFRDIVEFTSIRLPNAYNELVLVVLDVFPGSKYNDLAISGLMVPDSFTPMTSRDVQSEIEKMKKSVSTKWK